MGFLCPRCQTEFTQSGSLQRHIRGVHEKKRHKCDQCEKDFADRSGLRYHKLTKHAGKKRKYNKKKCPHCNKSFNTGSAYNRHLLTHQSLKPFLCPFCSSYAAKQLANLKTHIDSLHFKCRWFCLMDGCNESATRDGYLQVHLKKKHKISSNFVNHMEQRRTAATPSSLTPVRGKLPSSTTNNNDPREASTSLRQQSRQQSFTVKFEDIDTQAKLRSLMNQLELIATEASSNDEAVDASSEIETEESVDSDNETDEAQETKESESEDSALYLVEEEMNKRRRLVWHNPDATASSSDDDDDDNDNDDGKKSNSKSSSSSSSSFSFTSKPKEKEEPKEEPKGEKSASSSSSGPPPRRIDVKPRMFAWIPTGRSSSRGIDVNRLQQEPSNALEPHNNWLCDGEQQEQEQEQKEEEKEEE